MNSAIKQIIGSFEKIGEDVVKEAVKVPVDVAAQAMESLGASSGKKGQQQQTPNSGNSNSRNLEDGAFGQLDQMKDPAARQAFAHEALKRLAGHGKEQKKSIWQEKQEEEMAKKERKKQEDAARAKQLKPMSQKQKRGHPGAKKAAQDQATERAKNTQMG